MWHQRIRKMLTKLALILPFASLITSCGTPTPPKPVDNDCQLLVNCSNCKIFGEGAESGNTKLDIIKDPNSTVEYTFVADVDPEKEFSYNLPIDISIKVDGKAISREKYTYDSTTGRFTMTLTGKKTEVNVEANDKYAVVIFANTGKSVIPTQKITIGNSVKAPFDPKPGEEQIERGTTIFGGWFKPSESGEFSSEYKFNTIVKENFTLHARWLAEKSVVTVSFNSAGGSPVPEQNLSPGRWVNEPAPPEYIQHEFSYWSKDAPSSTGGQRQYHFDKDYVGFNNFTLFAVWDKAIMNIVFNRSNEAQAFSQDAKWEYGEVSDPTRSAEGFCGDNFKHFIDSHDKLDSIKLEHYEFMGWSHSSTEYDPIKEDEEIAQKTTEQTEIQLYPFFTPVLYKITFHGNNGGWSNGNDLIRDKTLDVAYGTSAEKLKELIDGQGTLSHDPDYKYSYNFDSWSPALEKVTGNAEYTAQWTSTLITYSLTADANGGTFSDGSTTKTLTFNESDPWSKVSSSLPEMKKREGYDFDNKWSWKKDDASTIIKQDEAITHTKDKLTVYAYFDIQYYDVTFNSDGGSPVTPQRIPYHGKVEEPAEPTKTGYKFNGWYKDGSETKYDFNTQITGPFTLTAHWLIKTYQLTFDANGGEITGETQYNVDYNAELKSFVDLVTATKDGHKFTGWKYTSGGEGMYEEGDKMPDSNVTLQAQYSINNYNLKFDANGGTLQGSGTVSVTYDTKWPDIKRLPLPIADRPGYTFQYWGLTKDAKNEIPETWTMPSKEVTIYAIWSAIEHEVAVHSNGGEFPGGKVLINLSIKTGQNWGVIINDDRVQASREGYNFDGFSITVDGPKINENDIYALGVKDIYARWNVKHCHIKFMIHDGILSDTVFAEYDVEWGKCSPVPPGEPTLAHHRFTGKWYYDDLFSTEFSFKDPIKSNLDVYAGFAINKWKLTFDMDGGVPDPVDATTVFYDIEYDSHPYTDPIFLLDSPDKATKTGYTFDEWTCGGEPLGPLAFWSMPDHDTVIKATYTINKYKVRFMSGKDEWRVVDVTYNQKVAEPTDHPELKGHEFKGWCSDEKCTKFFDFNKPITSNTKIYAKFAPIKYNVKFDANGGKFQDGTPSITKALDYGTKIQDGKPDNPTTPPPGKEASHHFAFWTKEKDKPETALSDKDLVPDNNDTIIYAYYEINVYDVTFDLNYEGAPTPPPAQRVEHGKTAAKPEDPERYGYDFQGWYLDKEGTESKKFDFATPITGNTKLYAKWTKHKFKVMFIDYDGTEISSQDVPYLDTPTKPADPTRDPDVAYTYKFAGWSPEIAPIEKDTTYYAQYTATPIDYAITWKYNPKGPTQETKTESHHYDDVLTPPETVDSYTSGLYLYKFIGWSPEIIPVCGNATYTAQYAKELRYFTVKWAQKELGQEETVLETDAVLAGEIPTYDGPTPEKVEHEHVFDFVGWDREIVPVTEDTTYYAEFDETVSASFVGTNCTVYGSHTWSEEIDFSNTIDLYIVADYGYALPNEITVYCDDKVMRIVDDYTYDPKTGHLYIQFAFGDIRIIASGRQQV